MNYRHCIVIVILVIVLFGCQHPVRQIDPSPVFIGPATEVKKPWTGLDFLNNPDNFQFAIISDLHGGYRRGIFEEAVKKINLMQPEFVLSVGDLIAGYTENKKVIDDQWAEFNERLAPLGMKFFFVPGNHDMSNLVMTREWEERFGRTFYHFIYRNVLFLCLNSEDPPDTHISDEQIAYVTKVLSENPNVRWTFTFMHKPLWLEKNTGWEKIETMLAGRPHTVLAGHNHRYTKYERHGQSYIRLATTGGASGLSGISNGEFDHITWVTATDTGPIIVNLALDGILDEDIVTEESIQMVDFLRNGQWLDIGSIVAETETFTAGTINISLSNMGSIPLKVRGAFMPHNQLTLSKKDIGVTIPPGGAENIKVEITAGKPVKFSDLDPLELKISGIYQAQGRLPIVSDGIHRIDFRHIWQGPEQIRNGDFSHNLEFWQTAIKARGSGMISVESEALKAKVAVPDPVWTLVAYQPVGTLKAGVDYQLSFRAQDSNPSGIISSLIRSGFAGGPDAPIQVDGQVRRNQLFNLTESMTPYTLNFRINSKKDLKTAVLLFVFAQANEFTIDDVSLRSVDKEKMPK